LASAGRSPGSEICAGIFTGRPGIAGMSTFACGSVEAPAVDAGAAAEAGAAGVVRPGMDSGNPGIDEAAGAPADGAAGAAAGAAAGEVKPGMTELRPGVVAAGAVAEAAPGVEADGVVSPGMSEVMPGAVAAGGAAGVAAVAGARPGKVIPGAAGAAGGVAPRAVAKLCRICGALAADATSCCGMLARLERSGAAGVGSAWAIPPASSAAEEPATTAVARK
jgi:hypothetical protein